MRWWSCPMAKKGLGRFFLSQFMTGKYETGAKISKLSNGLTVGSLLHHGDLSAVGAFVKAGSRYCANYPDGITHVLKRIAFTGTEKFRKCVDVGDKVNSCQGMIDCQSTRDLAAYAMIFNKNFTMDALEVLSEALLNPVYSDELLKEVRQVILMELEQQKYSAEPELEFTQLRFAAAYKDNTLGIPELATVESLEQISTELLYAFHKQFYTPDRIVVAAINVDHEELLECVDKHMNFSRTSWASRDIKLPTFDDSLSQYTGGHAIHLTHQPRAQPGHVEFPELAHVGIGFRGFCDADPDLYPAYVMYSLLGSGRSFSSGGPGKGLFTRLNMNVLCRHHAVNSCMAETFSFPDTGIFYIHGSCVPDFVPEFVDIILEQYYSIIKKPISDEELSRAKRQIQSLALSSLEQRSVMLEDLGRSIMSLGKSLSPYEVYDKLESVDAQDIKRVCEKMMDSKASVAAMGQVHALPQYSDIQDAVTKRKLLSSGFQFRLW